MYIYIYIYIGIHIYIYIYIYLGGGNFWGTNDLIIVCLSEFACAFLLFCGSAFLGLKLDKQFPTEQFEATVSQSTVPSHHESVPSP